MQVTVKPGDTLGAIALEHMGDARLASRIYEASRQEFDKWQFRDGCRTRGLTGPDWIFPGMVLTIPRAPASTDAPAPSPDKAGLPDQPTA